MSVTTRTGIDGSDAAKHRRYRRKQHGTEGEYRRGCRCPRCTKASTDARRLRAEKRDHRRQIEDLNAEIQALNRVEATPGKVCNLSDPALWRAYELARQELRVAEATKLALEARVKGTMQDAELLRVNGRTVATWKPYDRTEYVVPARTIRRFLPTDSLPRMFQRNG